MGFVCPAGRSPAIQQVRDLLRAGAKHGPAGCAVQDSSGVECSRRETLRQSPLHRPDTASTRLAPAWRTSHPARDEMSIENVRATTHSVFQRRGPTTLGISKEFNPAPLKNSLELTSAKRVTMPEAELIPAIAFGHQRGPGAHRACRNCRCCECDLRDR